MNFYNYYVPIKTKRQDEREREYDDIKSAAGTLILKFPASRTRRNKFLLLINSLV
jgi:hypothetical protein